MVYYGFNFDSRNVLSSLNVFKVIASWFVLPLQRNPSLGIRADCGGVDENMWDLAISTSAWSTDFRENSNKQAKELRDSLVSSPGFSPVQLLSLLPLTQILKLPSDECYGSHSPACLQCLHLYLADLRRTANLRVRDKYKDVFFFFF